jgi:small subunit ribosomal protein S19
MPRKFSYCGYKIEDLQKMPLDQFVKILPSKPRRMINRDILGKHSPKHKKLLEKIRNVNESENKKPIRTHLRDMVVIPEMVGLKFGVYNGKEFVTFEITAEMIGHRLGEFAQTRRKVSHGAPGIGATRSSLYIPLK